MCLCVIKRTLLILNQYNTYNQTFADIRCNHRSASIRACVRELKVYKLCQSFTIIYGDFTQGNALILLPKTQYKPKHNTIKH